MAIKADIVVAKIVTKQIKIALIQINLVTSRVQVMKNDSSVKKILVTHRELNEQYDYDDNYNDDVEDKYGDVDFDDDDFYDD